jgi:hypothetical protein
LSYKETKTQQRPFPPFLFLSLSSSLLPKRKEKLLYSRSSSKPIKEEKRPYIQKSFHRIISHFACLIPTITTTMTEQVRNIQCKETSKIN